MGDHRETGVGFTEALLSADGAQVIARKSTCTRGVQSGPDCHFTSTTTIR